MLLHIFNILDIKQKYVSRKSSPKFLFICLIQQGAYLKDTAITEAAGRKGEAISGGQNIQRPT